MNENFLGFQLAREEHNASVFYHEKYGAAGTRLTTTLQIYEKKNGTSKGKEEKYRIAL